MRYAICSIYKDGDICEANYLHETNNTFSPNAKFVFIKNDIHFYQITDIDVTDEIIYLRHAFDPESFDVKELYIKDGVNLVPYYLTLDMPEDEALTYLKLKYQ